MNCVFFAVMPRWNSTNCSSECHLLFQCVYKIYKYPLTATLLSVSYNKLTGSSPWPQRDHSSSQAQYNSQDNFKPSAFLKTQHSLSLSKPVPVSTPVHHHSILLASLKYTQKPQRPLTSWTKWSSSPLPRVTLRVAQGSHVEVGKAYLRWRSLGGSCGWFWCSRRPHPSEAAGCPSAPVRRWAVQSVLPRPPGAPPMLLWPSKRAWRTASWDRKGPATDTRWGGEQKACGGQREIKQGAAPAQRRKNEEGDERGAKKGKEAEPH